MWNRGFYARGKFQTYGDTRTKLWSGFKDKKTGKKWFISVEPDFSIKRIHLTKSEHDPFGLMLRFAGDPQRVRSGRLCMAEYGEWNRKGASLSDKTAKKEYGVSRDFIVKGIRAGRLEYRNGSVWGNPYIKILRRQLEQYIAEVLGSDRLTSSKTQTELRKIKQEMADLKKRLKKLQTRRTELEKQMKT